MTTADERAADKIGRAIDGQIRTLQNERATLLAGPARIVEIDAEIIELQREKARIDPRRPPQSQGIGMVNSQSNPRSANDQKTTDQN